MPSALVTLSGVSARVTLGRDAMPHNIFLIGAHEYPLGDLSYRATATPANIIEGGGTHRHTGCIRTFRDRLHYCLRALGTTFIDRPSNDALRWIEQASIRAGIELRGFFSVTHLHQLRQSHTIFYRRHFGEDGDGNL